MSLVPSREIQDSRYFSLMATATAPDCGQSARHHAPHAPPLPPLPHRGNLPAVRRAAGRGDKGGGEVALNIPYKGRLTEKL